MVATTEGDRSKPLSSNKVSKPLMEKKRRARINQCLDQLKSLLENHYSATIRKRKLEKADILELTVRYLKNLQKIQRFSSAAPESEYATGFRSCVSNVNHYLLTAEHVTGADRWKLSQLTSRLREEGGSTMDSSCNSQHARRLAPSPDPGSEEPHTATCQVYSTTTQGNTRRRGIISRGTQRNTQTGTSKAHCAVLNDQLRVWRPW